MLVKLSYSETTKMNLFKMLDFQKIHFFKKPWKQATHFAQPNRGNKSFQARSSDFKSTPHLGISNSDHQFLGTLKKEMTLFENNKSSFENILGFQALKKPHFENKGDF